MAENNTVDIITEYHETKVKPKIKEIVEQIETIADDLKDAEVIIPVKTSELTNDSGFQTADEVAAAIAAAISGTGHASFKKVNSIPSAAEAEDNVLYLVMNSATNHYDIYAKVGAEVVLIDDTTVDLSDYATKAELGGKVDKVTGKGLSTNDYTTTEKNKLAGLENYTHPASHAASMITQDSTHRFVTDTEKSVWNNKISVVKTQAELNSAVSAALSSGNTTIILGRGSYDLSGLTIGNIVFVGMGQLRTTVTHDGGFTDATRITFRDMTVRLSNRYEVDETCSLVFENCKVSDRGYEIYYGTGDLTFAHSTLSLTSGSDLFERSCFSGIAKARNVNFIGGEISIVSDASYDLDFDRNLIYECQSFQFTGTRIKCSGVGLINLIYKGSGSISGGSISLAHETHSICHFTADTDAHSTLTGVTIDYFKTYLNFATVTGCTFNHKAAGSSSANQIILQCNTNMTGNHFLGSAAYVDGQNKKHIVDRNLSDNGITTGSMASGSVTTNNITY